VTRRPPGWPEPVVREVGWSAGPRADKARKVILDAANRVFLEAGYSSVRVEDIAKAANISRSLFYVYFPSKRDVFLALGTDSIADGMALIDQLDTVPAEYTRADIERWLAGYLDYLEHFGAFIRSWDEAVAIDPTLQRISQHHVGRFCRNLGLSLDRLRGRPRNDPMLEGLSLRGSIEGVWYYWRVADLPHDSDELIAMLASVVETYIE